MVELASAVVGDIDDLDAVLHGELRVLDGGDALEDERDVAMLVPEPLDVVPGKAGLERLAFVGARAPRLDEAADEIALATAVHLHVHGDAERAEAVVPGAAYPVVHPR